MWEVPGRAAEAGSRSTWDPACLESRVNIEILAKIAQKAPRWMIGWWKLEIGATKEFVYNKAFRDPLRSLTVARRQAPSHAVSLDLLRTRPS